MVRSASALPCSVADKIPPSRRRAKPAPKPGVWFTLNLRDFAAEELERVRAEKPDDEEEAPVTERSPKTE